MKTIPLTQGKVAIVDDEDYDLVSQFKWSAHRRYDSGCWYAVRNTTVSPRKRKLIGMHRFILGMPNGMVDHVNRDGLDNRRLNLRVGTMSQNMMNQRKIITSTSPYKGIHFDKWSGRWQARIQMSRKKYTLGRFDTPEEARDAYRTAAKELFGDYARFE